VAVAAGALKVEVAGASEETAAGTAAGTVVEPGMSLASTMEDPCQTKSLL
tara:strand:+ start:201 stop:350 length:150 start_codon:yes stop_codon:yes gene_type:complete